MTAKIASLQIGKVVTEGDPETNDVTRRLWSSAFDKRPVAHSVTCHLMGIEGDEVADTKNHGGADKAVLCYSAEHYLAWQREHPELQLGPGSFGENLTIKAQSETNVCIGDRYQVGECEIEVSQPRQPCWKIARRWACKTLPKEVARTGRTGWYVRISRSGRLQTGDQLTLLDRPYPTWSISRANGFMFNQTPKDAALDELLQIPVLAKAWKSSFA
ncbi:6-N-hydroxylaminopurine resistance protein [Rubripirellula amarantea]|uniref:6-N-hydroxylaminopurine resistance protein n=1 Tax=Rubripirellula amarantea TaxID=2527999 RepID=A0A5C5WTT1_9BACT|nr:MOSC domain-containing protein [Rubripirellula amarantea]TWT53599.1 6-N-hydroxylaminopurine resistance protein [Rubripirellula amarantea]